MASSKELTNLQKEPIVKLLKESKKLQENHKQPKYSFIISFIARYKKKIFFFKIKEINASN